MTRDPAKDRYEPMPSFMALPAWLWRRASRRLRVVIAALVVAGVAGVLIVINAGEAERRAAARAEDDYRARALARVEREQAPHYGRASGNSEMVRAIERAVNRDKSMILDGRQPVTSCRRVTPVDRLGEPVVLPARDAYFTCYVEQQITQTIAARLKKGYFVRARGDLRTRRFAWCRLNQRPIHADQEEFIRAPLSRECSPTGR